MPDPTARNQASLLAALAQVTRLKILARVAEAGPRGMAAGDIGRALNCPASTLSFHLKELARSGVLEPRPVGRFIHYALRRHALEELARYIAGLAGARGRSRERGARMADRNQLSMFGD